MPEPIPLWPDASPSGGQCPSITAYLVDQPRCDGLVVVLPGGGYRVLADHEKQPVVDWLSAQGFHAALLAYRVGDGFPFPAPFHDGQRGIRLVRSLAEQWGVNPHAVAAIGFSAGGHLTSLLATLGDQMTCENDDLASQYTARPDVAVMAYAPTNFVDHKPSRWPLPLFGPNPSDELIELLSTVRHVTAGTPPTFLYHTAADEMVMVEHSIEYAHACRAAGVPFELHVYERGRHGQALYEKDPTLAGWMDQCVDFLDHHLRLAATRSANDAPHL